MVADGLEALTLQRVAAELGLVTTAIYRYFASKDAMIAALQRSAVSTLHTHFSAVRVEVTARTRRLAPDVAALVPLLAVSRAYVALPTTHRDDFRLVSILLSDPRRLVGDDEVARAAPLVGALLADIQSMFDEAASVGALDAAGASADRTLVLWAALHGLTQLEKLRRLAPHAKTAQALCDDASSSLLRGFGAEPGTLSRARRALDKTVTDNPSHKRART